MTTPSDIVLRTRSATALIDRINYYATQHYIVDSIWYQYEWMWLLWYYARLKYYVPPPPPKPTIDFIIGPITNRHIPKPPPKPTIEFIVGPITNRIIKKPPPPPTIEFNIGPILTKDEFKNTR